MTTTSVGHALPGVREPEDAGARRCASGGDEPALTYILIGVCCGARRLDLERGQRHRRRLRRQHVLGDGRGLARRRRRRRGLAPAHRRLPARRPAPPRSSTCSRSTSSARCSSRRSGACASRSSTSCRCSPGRSARCCSSRRAHGRRVRRDLRPDGRAAVIYAQPRHRTHGERARALDRPEPADHVHDPGHLDRRPHRRPGRRRPGGVSSIDGVERFRVPRDAATVCSAAEVGVAGSIAVSALGRAPAVGRTRLARPRPGGRVLRRRHAVGVEQVAEELDAVDQPRARAREVRRGVDRHDARAERGEARARSASPPPPRAPRRSRTAWRPPRRAPRPATSSHSAVRDFSPGMPSTSSRPRARSSAAPSGRRRRRGRAIRARRPRTRSAPRYRVLDRVDPARQLRRQALSRLAPRRRPSASRGTSASTSPSVVGSSESTSAAASAAPPRRPDVVVGDRADLADGLGHDQVGLELARAGPRRARRAPRRARCARAPRASISARREPLRDHAARQMGESLGAWRIIALVGDPDDGVAQAESEQHLGR